MIYKNNLDKSLNYVIKKGNFKKNKPVHVRVLSQKFKNNSFNLNSNKLTTSLNYLSKFNEFALIIIKDQKTPKQEIFDEYKSNIIRYYGIELQIIKDLRIQRMILVSRSKKKIIALDGYDIKIIKQNNKMKKKKFYCCLKLLQFNN